jgi:hypothetical protein
MDALHLFFKSLDQPLSPEEMGSLSILVYQEPYNKIARLALQRELWQAAKNPSAPLPFEWDFTPNDYALITADYSQEMRGFFESRTRVNPEQEIITTAPEIELETIKHEPEIVQEIPEVALATLPAIEITLEPEVLPSRPFSNIEFDIEKADRKLAFKTRMLIWLDSKIKMEVKQFVEEYKDHASQIRLDKPDSEELSGVIAPEFFESEILPISDWTDQDLIQEEDTILEEPEIIIPEESKIISAETEEKETNPLSFLNLEDFPKEIEFEVSGQPTTLNTSEPETNSQDSDKIVSESENQITFSHKNIEVEIDIDEERFGSMFKKKTIIPNPEAETILIPEPEKEPELIPEPKHLAEPEKKIRKNPDLDALIERFIENEPNISFGKSDNTTYENLAQQFTKEPELISETLARILMKQGHKIRAIKMLEKLSQVHPEKQDHYRDLISEAKSIGGI